MRPAAALALLLSLSPAPGAAQPPPDLARQDLWGPTEKSEFLRYLRSGQGAPVSGDVRTAPYREEEATPIPRKPRFLSAEFQTDTLFTVAGDGRVIRESTSIGPKVLAGGHLFSWVRYYSGLAFNSMSQGLTNGTRADVSHWQAPAGVELALVPLGTPQTRYVILRAGFTLHYFASGTDRSRFNTPLLGWQGSWNAGVGYEWQLAETNWRVHALVEGYKSLVRNGAAPFYGLGFTSGVVRTF